MSFNNHLAGPLPAMRPIHPPKDETPQVGDIYEKRATTKTSNAPRIRIDSLAGDRSVNAKPINFVGKYGWKSIETRTMRRSTLLNEWRKLT